MWEYWTTIKNTAVCNHVHFDRQLECRNRAIEQVNDVFRHAIRAQVTHADILQHLASMYSPEFKARLTIAQKEYVRGYVTARFDCIWRDHIAWGFKPCGVFCATFEQVQAEFHDEIVADRANGFHYWIGSNGSRSYT